MNVIAYALWGNSPKYNVGAIRNAESALELYPGWLCRFYCASDVPQETISILSKFKNVEIIKTFEQSNWKYSTNRFLSMSESGIDRMISRDTDSRLSIREVEAVNEWIKQDTSAHVMRDHPYHGGFPILAGMFGIKCNVIKNVKALLKLADQVPEQYHYDQIFLQNYIWPFVQNNVTIHDEFFTHKLFPSKRISNFYVGQPFDENDRPCFPEHANLVLR